jgi:uncharacterized protein YuzE
MSIMFEMDPFADAVYIQVECGRVARMVDLDPQRILSYNEYGEVVGIEFLGVRRGVNLSNIPYRDELARYFGEHQIHIVA